MLGRLESMALDYVRAEAAGEPGTVRIGHELAMAVVEAAATVRRGRRQGAA